MPDDVAASCDRGGTPSVTSDLTRAKSASFLVVTTAQQCRTTVVNSRLFCCLSRLAPVPVQETCTGVPAGLYRPARDRRERARRRDSRAVPRDSSFGSWPTACASNNGDGFAVPHAQTLASTAESRVDACSELSIRGGRHARGMAAQGLSMHVGSKTCQLVPTLLSRLVTAGNHPVSRPCQTLPTWQPRCPGAQLPSCYSTPQLTHAAQAVISLATASELLAVAHRRSGETLEYLQTMYRVRLKHRTRPSSVPLASQ